MSTVNMLVVAVVFAAVHHLLVVGSYSDYSDAPRPTSKPIRHHRHQHFVTTTRTYNQAHPHHHQQHSSKHHQHQHHQQQPTPWLPYEQQFNFNAGAATMPTTIKAADKKLHERQESTSLAYSGFQAAHATFEGHSSRHTKVKTPTNFLSAKQTPSAALSLKYVAAESKHAHPRPSALNTPHDVAMPRSKSLESEYVDDYYYDDVVDLDDEYEEHEDAANELGEVGAGERRGHVHASHSAAPPHRGRYMDEEHLLAINQDYADDEPYRSSAEVYQNDAPGVLTDQKFRELGTLEAVQQTRDKYLLDQEHVRLKTPAELAREHMDRMKSAGRCSRPLPRVIHVSNETSKRYVPYCTILHRCGEDTGCCDSTRQVCAAKNFEDVPVYFFVIKVSSRSNKRDTEVLMLRNHTECHCVDRSILSASMQYMPRDKRSELSQPRYHLRRKQHEASSDQPAAEATNSICRCPKHFDVFPDDGPPSERSSGDVLRCRCDCLSHNLPCQRLQSGEEGFAVDERKCIAESSCQTPVCLHGLYNRHTGRCPRRKNHQRPLTRYDYGYG